MRLPTISLPALLAASPTAHADATALGRSVRCSVLNNRAMGATLVIRQHASAPSLGIDQQARVQGFVPIGRLAQWTGRLHGLFDVAGCVSSFDDGEPHRRALATARRVANTAREELLRPTAATAQQQAPHRRN